MRVPVDGSSRTEPIRRWVLLVVAVLTPLIFITGEFTQPYNVPKMAVLVAGTGLALALKLYDMAASGHRWRVFGLWVPVTSICGPLFASWAISPYRGWALFGQYPRFQGLLPYLVFGLFGLLLVDAFGERPVVLAWALTGAAAAAGGYALVQSLGLDPLTWYYGGVPFPFTGSTGGHVNYTGGFLAIALPVAMYLWVRAARARPLAILAMVLIGAGLLVSLSQGPWVAAAGGVIIVVASLLAGRIPSARWLGLVAAGVMATVVIAPILASLVAGEGRDGLLGGTSRSRATFWEASMSLGIESPILGRGPNSFAVDGVRYRPLEDALRNGHNFTDDPHSVPLSFLANAGFVGLVGYIGVIVWAVGRFRRLDVDNILGHAFAGAFAAYFIQGLVGIDEPTQRIGMWIALGGLAICSATRPIETKSREPARTSMRITAAVGCAVLGVAAVSWGWLFLEADRNVVQAIGALHAGRQDDARELFDSAIAFRDEFEFREIYAGDLGQAALAAGEEGAPLIEEMNQVNSYLEMFPQHFAIAVAGELLHYWGHFDPEADRMALSTFERLLELDPENPLVEIEIGEVLLDLDRPDDAVALLEEIAPSLEGRMEDFWSMLAIARFRGGDLEGADSALDLSDVPAGTSCRNLIAHRLLAPPSAEPPQVMAFSCPRGLIDWYEDQRARIFGNGLDGS